MKIVRSLAAGTLLVFGAGTALAAAQSGAEMYQDAGCAACHRAEGQGVPGVFPRLAERVGAIAATAEGRKYLVSAVSFGMTGSIEVDGRTINGLMPGHSGLSDEQITGILNWVATLDNANSDEAFTTDFVHKIRSDKLTASQVHALRESTLKKK